MRRLTVIVAAADPARLSAALEVAAAWAALDRPARLFLQGETVGLMRQPIAAPDDTRRTAAGLPRLEDLLDEAMSLGVGIIACQTGLSLSGGAASDLREGIVVGGLVSLLADAEDDQLLFA